MYTRTSVFFNDRDGRERKVADAGGSNPRPCPLPYCRRFLGIPLDHQGLAQNRLCEQTGFLCEMAQNKARRRFLYTARKSIQLQSSSSSVSISRVRKRLKRRAKTKNRAVYLDVHTYIHVQPMITEANRKISLPSTTST